MLIRRCRIWRIHIHVCNVSANPVVDADSKKVINLASGITYIRCPSAAFYCVYTVTVRCSTILFLQKLEFDNVHSFYSEQKQNLVRRVSSAVHRPF